MKNSIVNRIGRYSYLTLISFVATAILVFAATTITDTSITTTSGSYTNLSVTNLNVTGSYLGLINYNTTAEIRAAQTVNTSAEIRAAQTVNTTSEIRAAQTVNTSGEVQAVAVGGDASGTVGTITVDNATWADEAAALNCSELYGGTDGDFCVDATSTNDSSEFVVIKVDNATFADDAALLDGQAPSTYLDDTDTYNTTAEIRAAQTVNTTSEIRAAQTVNTSGEVQAVTVGGDASGTVGSITVNNATFADDAALLDGQAPSTYLDDTDTYNTTAEIQAAQTVNTSGEVQAVTVGGETSGTVGSITLSNTALDDQYRFVADNFYLYLNSLTFTLNETKLNATIDDRSIAVDTNCSADGVCGLITYDSELAYIANCSVTDSCANIQYGSELTNTTAEIQAVTVGGDASGTVGSITVDNATHADSTSKILGDVLDVNKITTTNTEVSAVTVFSWYVQEMSVGANGNNRTAIKVKHHQDVTDGIHVDLGVSVDSGEEYLNRFYSNYGDRGTYTLLVHQDADASSDGALKVRQDGTGSAIEVTGNIDVNNNNITENNYIKFANWCIFENATGLIFTNATGDC